VEAAAERWTQVRGPDARALADIEASFYKLVGGRRLGFLDPGFLRLIAHIGLGVPHRLTASLLPRACNGQSWGVGLTVMDLPGLPSSCICWPAMTATEPLCAHTVLAFHCGAEGSLVLTEAYC